ncbi:MAG: aldo/keto reductase [Deltaproteobacteria bacterium]
MQTRKLGKNGPAVGAIGLGAMSFAGAYGAADPADVARVLAEAVDLGVTHIDTARLYGMGRSEELVGQFLKTTKAKLSIATKGGIEVEPQRHFVNSKFKLTEHLEGSLRRLGVEHVDLYYVHRRDQSIPIEDVTETLAGFQKAGKIGGFGFSEISPASLRRAHAVAPVSAVQNEYSLWTRQPDLGMVQACAELGVAFVAFSPLGRGIFSEEVFDLSQVAEGEFRRMSPRFSEPNFSQNQKAIAGFRALAREVGISTPGLAIAWTLSRGDHVIPIPGTRSVEHLRQDVEGAGFVMTPEVLARIDALLPVGFAHGDRYSDSQSIGVERYC